MPTAKDLVRQTSALVSLPEIYLRIKQILEDPKAGMVDVADVISRDPGLAARILKIANSAFFGFPSRVETVTQAANLLGEEKINNLVLSTTVTRAFARISEKHMNMDMFWQDSIYRAVLSQLLAKHYQEGKTERSFIQGLLADVGHLVMFQVVPDLCHSALIKSSQENTPLHRIETQLVGCHYAQVGGELLKSWELPENLWSVVRFQHDPAAADQFAPETAIVNLANEITRSADPDTPITEREFESDWIASRLSPLTEDQVNEMRKEADKGAQEALELIFPGHSMAA